MSTKRIWAIFIRQYFLIKGNPTRLASMFLWTIINILMWGFISRYLGTFGQATFSVVTVLLGAIILWDLLSRIQQGIMFTFLDDVWSQNFINFFASPLRVSEYIGGMVLTSMATSTIGFAIMAVMAGLLFGYNIFMVGLLLLVLVAILILFGISVGIFITALIFRLGPSAEWLGWPIPFMLSIFSGVYYPVSTLPLALQIFAKIIPASYVFESMRAVLAGSGLTFSLGINLFIGAALSVAYILITGAFFIKVYKHNLETGGIARFSAEQ